VPHPGFSRCPTLNPYWKPNASPMKAPIPARCHPDELRNPEQLFAFTPDSPGLHPDSTGFNPNNFSDSTGKATAPIRFPIRSHRNCSESSDAPPLVIPDKYPLTASFCYLFWLCMGGIGSFHTILSFLLQILEFRQYFFLCHVVNSFM